MSDLVKSMNRSITASNLRLRHPDCGSKQIPALMFFNKRPPEPNTPIISRWYREPKRLYEIYSSPDYGQTVDNFLIVC